MKVYERMWTDTEWDQVSALQAKFPGLVNEDNSFQLVFKTKRPIRVPVDGDNSWPLSVDVLVLTLPEPRPMPETCKNYSQQHPYVFMANSLPSELLRPIVAWVPRWLQCMAETAVVKTKLDSLFKHCNTMGQVKRVWPNICSFLPERAQEKLRNAKVQSPYPTSMLDDEGRLKAAWLPETLAWYDRIITESLLLPEYESDSDIDWSMRVSWESHS
jgi:hypothetical protein